ncbi:hypothetical protein [Maricaulis sp.]|uniref:hypothetical protein n=1 Tax=Maricaulis sp. TaxID=1486257 RepID=UPI003A8EB92F
MQQGPDLDEVHDLLEGVEFSQSQLKSSDSEFADHIDLSGITTAVLVLYGGHVDYGSPEAKQLGVPPKLINSLIKPSVKILRQDALVLANRLHSQLRSLEGELAPDGVVTAPEERRPSQSAAEPSGPTNSGQNPIRVKATQWAAPPTSTNIKQKIFEVSALLDDIVYFVRASNQPDDERALTEIERTQLIAVLETALSILKAPLLEKGLLEKCRDLLKRAARRTAENKVEETLGTLADKGVDDIADLIDQIPWDAIF